MSEVPEKWNRAVAEAGDNEKWKCTCGAGNLNTQVGSPTDRGKCESCGRVWDRSGTARFETMVVIRGNELETLEECAAECGQTSKEWIGTAIGQALGCQSLIGQRWKQKKKSANGPNGEKPRPGTGARTGC